MLMTVTVVLITVSWQWPQGRVLKLVEVKLSARFWSLTLCMCRSHFRKVPGFLAT